MSHTDAQAAERSDQLSLAQVVSPAIQPRALWAFVPNLELASTMDATWMHFMRALAAALSASEDLSMSRKCAS